MLDEKEAAKEKISLEQITAAVRVLRQHQIRCSKCQSLLVNNYYIAANRPEIISGLCYDCETKEAH